MVHVSLATDVRWNGAPPDVRERSRFGRFSLRDVLFSNTLAYLWVNDLLDLCLVIEVSHFRVERIPAFRRARLDE